MTLAPDAGDGSVTSAPSAAWRAVTDQRNQLVVFTLDERRYGLDLSAVERALRMVDITPLPQAPEIVLGVVDVQGRVVPVFDVRRRFGLPERAIALEDQLLLARTARRWVALAVETVIGVRDYPQQQAVAAHDVLPALHYVEGVAKLDDGLVLIHDLEKFLALEEQATLESALERAP